MEQKKVIKPPVETGQEHELYIENIGPQGDGIAKINGYVIIVKNPDNTEIKHTTVKCRIVRTGLKYAFAHQQ